MATAQELVDQLNLQREQANVQREQFANDIQTLNLRINQMSVDEGQMKNQLAAYAQQIASMANLVNELNETVKKKEIKEQEKSIVNMKGLDAPKKLNSKPEYKVWAKGFLAHHSMYNDEWEKVLELKMLSSKDEVTEEMMEALQTQGY